MLKNLKRCYEPGLFSPSPLIMCVRHYTAVRASCGWQRILLTFLVAILLCAERFLFAPRQNFEPTQYVSVSIWRPAWRNITEVKCLPFPYHLWSNTGHPREKSMPQSISPCKSSLIYTWFAHLVVADLRLSPNRLQYPAQGFSITLKLLQKNYFIL